jgi:hypothetical protein
LGGATRSPDEIKHLATQIPSNGPFGSVIGEQTLDFDYVLAESFCARSSLPNLEKLPRFFQRKKCMDECASQVPIG